VADCASHLVVKVWKRSIKFWDSFVNQLNAAPFKEAGNTEHNIASSSIYKPTWIVYISRHSLGLVVPSYNSNEGFFQFGGRDTSITSLVKG